MKRVRIHGLVKLANHVRHEISQPISSKRLTKLRENTSRSIETVNRTLNNVGVNLEALPTPSRKAYEFLSGIDFNSVETNETSSSLDLVKNSVSFPGLKSYLNGLLDQIAQNPEDSQLRHIYDSIQKSSSNIEGQLKVKNIKPEQLKLQSRLIRGWLAFFAQRENFNKYLAAIRRAEPVFYEVLPEARKQLGSMLIHFRPMQGIYRIRWYKNSTIIQLPTQMICFDREAFQLLAEQIFHKSPNKKQVLSTMLSESYQQILSELDLLSGFVEQTKGVYYDLAASFDRVNAKYFNGNIRRPRLVWSHTFTLRKFGHYDRTRDTVMVSMSLDKKGIPEYVTDFIMYHELLHKALGIMWNNHRQAVHTPQFLEKERCFHQYLEAKAVLKKLASGQR
ncbi:hypothetical protein ACFL5F_01045 [Planctomycetota bacterium]